MDDDSPPPGRHYEFPHYKTPCCSAEQPDYAKWRQVSEGMSRSDVRRILGDPMHNRYWGDAFSLDDFQYCYGYLEFPMTPHVRTYDFTIIFDDDDRVAIISDPFSGIFSPDGKPTKPIVFTPTEGASFAHYPRIVDMRWQPVSGVYPMWYEVEVGSGFDEPSVPWDDRIVEAELPFTYYVHEFVGDNPGRFRIRGRNELGRGEWSDYRHFQFDTT